MAQHRISISVERNIFDRISKKLSGIPASRVPHHVFTHFEHLLDHALNDHELQVHHDGKYITNYDLLENHHT